ncbi:MAG: PAS domain-containing sensor histidine kinase [Bacteroidales bacterium]|nr:PAS domain-containing sensor histidine kinase [Bacteroidales bacterium]
MRKKVNYMLDALEDGETNFRFSEKKAISGGFNKTLNRINSIFRKERFQILEQEKFFGTLLDDVNTGIVVYDASSGIITYSNQKALQILGFASLLNIRQLRLLDKDLAEAFICDSISPSEKSRVSFYNENSQKTIVMSRSSAKVKEREVKIVSFNDVTQEMESNQEEAWSKLIRVLTHEIMNTVTPISSLSDALVSYLEPEELNPDRRKAIRDGLDTIAASSKSLIKFVESYRNLTRVATPVKSVFYVKELAEEVISLTNSQMEGKRVLCTYSEKSNDVILFADRGQILQILINLVKNAIQANASKIEINSRIDSADSTVIEVSNNGNAISQEAQKQMFIPLYTTKTDGSGIGLSLSRQIMRLHNGQINLVSTGPDKTVFNLIFR